MLTSIGKTAAGLLEEQEKLKMEDETISLVNAGLLNTF